jgi:hypothetical protein
MVNSRLSKDDWLKAARLPLFHKGPDGVRVEPLAKELGGTKALFTGTSRIATISSKLSSVNGKRRPTSSSKTLVSSTRTARSEKSSRK